MAVYQAVFIYFCQNIYFFVLLLFIDNLRNLEKKIMTWGKLFFLITWHNLYTSEKLSLCRLKAVKGYLLSYQYFSFPLNPPTYFRRIFLEEWQPWGRTKVILAAGLKAYTVREGTFQYGALPRGGTSEKEALPSRLFASDDCVLFVNLCSKYKVAEAFIPFIMNYSSW